MLALEVALLSDRGGRKYNEDACGHWHSGEQLCCVLADGAGGHGGGDKASKLAVQFILGAFAETPEGTPEAIERMILATNRSIIQHRADDRALQNAFERGLHAGHHAELVRAQVVEGVAHRRCRRHEAR